MVVQHGGLPVRGIDPNSYTPINQLFVEAIILRACQNPQRRIILSDLPLASSSVSTPSGTHSFLNCENMKNDLWLLVQPFPSSTHLPRTRSILFPPSLLPLCLRQTDLWAVASQVTWANRRPYIPAQHSLALRGFPPLLSLPPPSLPLILSLFLSIPESRNVQLGEPWATLASEAFLSYSAVLLCLLITKKMPLLLCWNAANLALFRTHGVSCTMSYLVGLTVTPSCISGLHVLVFVKNTLHAERSLPQYLTAGALKHARCWIQVYCLSLTLLNHH